MHTQLEKDVTNNYSKGNQDAYPSDIHKALTLMNEYRPLKLDNPVVAAQGTVFATKGSHKGGKKGGSKSKKYYSDAEWKALSSEAQAKIINERKKAIDDADIEKSAASAKSSKSIKSLTKTMKALEKDNRRLKKSVSALQKCNEDDNNDSTLSSVEGSTHFQEAVEILSDSYPKIALALKP
jgi:chromosome segregation ATPase